ncbi:MAG: FG-GAP repeat domain-containing protein, partial [Granulosicoccaceae bacterium]
MNSIKFRRSSTVLFSLLVALLLNSCGGGGSSSGGSAGGGTGGGGADDSSSSVEGMLNRLEVNTEGSERLGANDEPLPDTYAPFGSRVTANRFSEIMLFGVPIDDASLSESRNEMAITNLVPGSNNSYSWELLHDEPLANTPWTDSDAARASAVGDFDGDGIDEIAVVYQLGGDVELRLMDDATEGYQIGSATVVDNESVAELFVAAGDFDGDSDVDLALGLVDNLGNAEVKMLANEGGEFRFNGLQLTFPKVVSNINHLVLRTGNLDQDAALELAVVVNTVGTDSRYSVFDDAAVQWSTLIQDAQIELDTSSGSVRAAVTNLDIGDIDGDGIDELLLAGMNKKGRVRNSDPYSSFDYMIEIRDDALEREGQRFAVLASGFDDVLTSDDGNYQPSSSGAQQNLEYLPVVLADVNGDGAKEFLVGQHLYHSQAAAPGVLSYYNDENSNTDDDGRARIPALE